MCLLHSIHIIGIARLLCIPVCRTKCPVVRALVVLLLNEQDALYIVGFNDLLWLTIETPVALN